MSHFLYSCSVKNSHLSLSSITDTSTLVESLLTESTVLYWNWETNKKQNVP